MPTTLCDDLMTRLGGTAVAGDTGGQPRAHPEPGVRLVDGELRYSDMWLDDGLAEPAYDAPDGFGDDEPA